MHYPAPLKEPEASSKTSSLSYLIRFYQFRILYLSSRLDYLNATKGQGPWDKEQVEDQLAHTKQLLEQLYDY